jgi:hypothetical protein
MRTTGLTTFGRSLSLAALAVTLGASIAAAQNNNPGNSGGTPGSRLAEPTYPQGQTDPALSPGRLPRGTAGVQADRNPNLSGATGNTVVPGDNSTVSADRRGTTQQKTGTVTQ